ncbi:MAG: phage baseplate assembly protein V [Selenomonadaceae bacterium]|nr:phage baseplate assembly protein V [Selenomonadaceae bacterium]MBR1805805.1 phage baseplate assembly protein V [Selenomonadaceae bacterium]
MTGDARQLVREGKVSSINAEKHMVRVVFEDKDGMTSAEMPILTPCAAGNKFYAMPDVGDMVVCLFASNSDMTGNGWIIGSRFNDKSKPNANSADVMRMDFNDDTFVEYNRKSHELKIKCAGKVIIEAEDKITLKSGDDIVFDAGGEIVFKGAKSYSLTATENVILKGEKVLINMEG